MKPKACRALFTAAAMALGLCRSTAGALFVDLRVTAVNGPAVLLSENHVLVNGSNARIEMDLWARIVGQDTVNDYNTGLISVSGSIVSSQSPWYQPGTMRGTSSAQLLAPFDGYNASVGTQMDLDGDGDLDIGGQNPTDPEAFFTATSSRWPGDNNIQSGATFRIGRASFVVDEITSAAIAQTILAFLPRQAATGAAWLQDGQMKNPLIGEFDQGFAVTVSAVVAPEPISFLLGAVATFASALRPRRR